MSTSEWPVIGIDLGTTYSCVAIWHATKQQAEIIVNESGSRTTPSVVAFTEHERFVGVAAKNQAAGNYQNTVYDSKRLLGKKYSDTCIQSDTKSWPFKVVSDGEDMPLFDVQFKGERKQFKPEEISAMVLSHIKSIAETYLGSDVKNAVVTVPAYFNDSQRRATIDAARIAGLNILRIINEPTAAAFAYGLEKIEAGDVKKKNVLIFDLGGGTFDVTILEIERGLIEVKAKSGDTHLGGQDFDNRLVDHLVKEFKRKTGVDISNSKRALQRLKTKCEEVKRMLSTTAEQLVYIESFHDGLDLNLKISQAKFEYLNIDLFESCIAIVESCLRDANMDKSLIDDVVLVGGSSRIPKIKSLLSESLNVKSFYQSINPDEAVAYGAAVQAAILGGVRSRLLQNIVLQDSTPLSLSVNNPDGTVTVVIPRNTTIPTSVKVVRQTVCDDQKNVKFKIYEGEWSTEADNTLLGEIDIYDLPLAPAGEVKFDVTYKIDSNSVLTITSVERTTGKSGNITMRYDRGRLTKEEVDRMIAKAEKYKIEDELQRQVALAKIELDEYADRLKRQIENRNISSHLDPSVKQKIQQEVLEAMKWSEENEYKAGPSDFRRKKTTLEPWWEALKVGAHLVGAFAGFSL